MVDAGADRATGDAGDARSPDARPETGADGPVDVRLTLDLADVSTGDDSFVASAGIWTGTSNQKLPVSLVLTEDG